VAVALISSNFVYVYAVAPKLQLRNGACDPNDPGACQAASRFSRVILWCSAALYIAGCFTACALGPLLVRFDRETEGRTKEPFEKREKLSPCFPSILLLL